jgi:hypothetical protein
MFLHGLFEYLEGALLIAVPFVLNFHAGAATAVSIVAGVIVLIVAATTVGPTSLVKSLPLSVHILLDFVFAGLLIAVPFLFGFSKESAPTAFFIVLGVVQLLASIATRYPAREGAHRAAEES